MTADGTAGQRRDTGGVGYRLDGGRRAGQDGHSETVRVRGQLTAISTSTGRQRQSISSSPCPRPATTPTGKRRTRGAEMWHGADRSRCRWGVPRCKEVGWPRSRWSGSSTSPVLSCLEARRWDRSRYRRIPGLVGGDSLGDGFGCGGHFPQPQRHPTAGPWRRGQTPSPLWGAAPSAS
jgi:hypothetical protein